MVEVRAQRASKPLRIGNCSGFYGDRALGDGRHGEGRRHRRPHRRLPRRGDDADPREGARRRTPGEGYAHTFLQHLDEMPGPWSRTGVRLVANAGGLNPAGPRDPRSATAASGLGSAHRRLSHLEGDEPRLVSAAGEGEPLASWPHGPLTAPTPTSAASASRGPASRRRHRHHRPGRRRLRSSSVPRPGTLAGDATTTTRSPARSSPDTSSNAGPGHRRQLLGLPHRPGRRPPGASRSPRSPPTAA